MIKYTKHYLSKLEEFLERQAYDIRYEKGNFQSGYCVVESKKMIVINKFFETESRINNLIEIISQIEIDKDRLDTKDIELYKTVIFSKEDIPTS